MQANVVTRVFLNQTGTGTPTGNGPIYFGSNAAVYLSSANGVQSKGSIKVTANDPIVVYSHIIKSARSAATLCLPTAVLGNSYIAPSMASKSTQGATNGGTIGGVSEVCVVATLANTVVTVTPTAPGRNGEVAGVPIVVQLPNAGDCYQFQSANLGDLSGTTITSSPASGSSGCKPIAAFSATTWSAFDCTGASGGDNLYQQLFPTKSWGKVFVTAPFINRISDIFRVYAQTSTTTVQIQENGVTKTLGAAGVGTYNSTGKYYTYSSGNPLVFTGSEPISVVQYITSETCKTGCTNSANDPQTCFADPEMVILNPVEQTLQDITFFSAHKDYVPAGQTAVVLHFVNVIISKNFKSTVKIDSKPNTGTFVDIPGTNYAYLQEDLTASSANNPIHRVTADTNFSAIVYGYGNVESYGYNGGTNVKDFTASTVFQNPYHRIDSAVTCVNTPLKFSVPLTFQPASIAWNFDLAPNISPKANVDPGSIVADSTKTVNGQVINYYGTGVTYTFTNANTAALRDTIRLFTTTATPDGCGSNSQTLSIPVKVYAQPGAKFSITNGGCVSDSIHLTDQSTVATGALSEWLWNFGDGTTDDRFNGDVFAKKYASAGTYSIKLKSISDIGCISAETTAAVTLTDKPVAKFLLPSVACVGTNIVFTDASTASPGPIVKWYWNLDNGAGAFTNTTNASVTANYPAYGNKTPTLQVELGNGCKSDVFSPTTQLTINPVPEVGFIAPAICLDDANAVFTDTSKIAQGSSSFTYLWNFNAGTPAVSPGPNITTSTAKNPLVTYRKADNYTVSLKVTSSLGCSATGSQSFTVNGSTPKAMFDFLSTVPFCGTIPVILTNKSTVNFGNLTRLELSWDAVNSPSARDIDLTPGTPPKNYQHSYVDKQLPAAQAYTVKLLAYSGGSSCVDSVSKNILVYPKPKAAFTVTDTAVCAGKTIQFTNGSNGISSTISSYHWNLGSGDASSLKDPQKAYSDSGVMAVSLYIINADGCISDTATKQLTVYPNPKLVLTPQVRALAGGTIKLIPEYVYGNNLSYLWTPATYLNSDTAANPLSTPLDDITYVLYLTGTGGCSVSDTTIVTVLKGPEVPNAFSPNGDGINDVWKIKYLDSYPDAVIQVFNRYGQVVFSSVGYPRDWDGTFKGSPLPVGTYYYIINPKNGRDVISGSVTIIK